MLFCSGSRVSSSAEAGSPRKSRPSLSISSSMMTGIVGLGAANALNDLAGQCADVGAAMAANLRLVVHAAQRDALELAAQSAGDGAAEAGFAHARRSDKAEDRPLHVGLEFEHAEIVENAIFDLLQLVVVLVEDLLGFADVDFGAGALGPGQNGQPLDVVAGERVVGGHGRHAREARQAP